MGSSIGLVLFVITLVAFLAFRMSRASAGPPDGPGLKPSRPALGTVGPWVFCAIMFAAALYVILSGRYDLETQKWAFGAVGTVAGWVLKG